MGNDNYKYILDKSVQIATYVNQMMKKDFKEEIAALKARVKELEEENLMLRKHYTDIRTEIRDEIKRNSVADLLKDVCNKLYVVRPKFVTPPKCEKCDSRRYIHFTSPQGNRLTERCNCAEPYKVYDVKESSLIEIYFAFDKSSYVYGLSSGNDYTTVTVNSSMIYNGQGVDTLSKDVYKWVFRDADDAQEYANYMNEGKADEE